MSPETTLAVVFPDGYRKPRVGIISKSAYSKGMVTALKEAGAKVVPLGDDPKELPPGLDAVVVRLAACSHAASALARTWGPRLDIVVIEANGSSTAVAALREHGVLLNIPTIAATLGLDPASQVPPPAPAKPERRRRRKKKRKPRRKPITFAPLEPPAMPKPAAPPAIAPRLDAKGWLLRTDFPDHKAWIVAQIRVNPAVANDWNAYTSACRRQRINPSKHSWGTARTALRKTGMAIPMKRAGTSLEARTRTWHPSVMSLPEAHREAARKRARIVDHIAANDSPRKRLFVPDAVAEFKAESKTVQILLRGVREALGGTPRAVRSDVTKNYKRKVAAYQLTACEAILVAGGVSLVFALEQADRIDGMGRVHHVPQDTEPLPKAAPPKTPQETEPDTMLRAEHTSDYKWALALLDIANGDITVTSFRELAAAEDHKPDESSYYRAVRRWRADNEFPAWERPMPGSPPRKANWRPEPEPIEAEAEAEAEVEADDVTLPPVPVVEPVELPAAVGSAALEVYEVVTRKRKVALRSYHLIEFLRNRGFEIPTPRDVNFTVSGEGAGLRIEVAWAEETVIEPIEGRDD